MHIVVDRRPAWPRPPASTGLAPWTWTMLDLSRHEIWIDAKMVMESLFLVRARLHAKHPKQEYNRPSFRMSRWCLFLTMLAWVVV